MKKPRIYRSTLRLPKKLRDAILKESRRISDLKGISVSMHSIIIDTLENRFPTKE